MARTRTKPPRVKPANSKPRASRLEPQQDELPHPEFEAPSDNTLERLDRERAKAVADAGAASKEKAEADAKITKRLDELGFPTYKAKSGRVLVRTTKDVLRVKRPPSKDDKAKAKVRGAASEG
jgi:hypothetical protein